MFKPVKDIVWDFIVSHKVTLLKLFAMQYSSNMFLQSFTFGINFRLLQFKRDTYSSKVHLIGRYSLVIFLQLF